MKKSLIFITIILLLGSMLVFGLCGPTKTLSVSVDVDERAFEGDPVTISVVSLTSDVTSADIYLFDAEGTQVEEIEAGVDIPEPNSEQEVQWTVSTGLEGSYRIRAYVGGDDPATADYAETKEFSIGYDPDMANIIIDHTVTFGATANWSFDLYMSENDDLVGSDIQASDGTVFDWAFDDLNLLTPDNLYSQTSSGNNDLPDSEIIVIDPATMDWGFLLTYDGQSYWGQFAVSFTELNNQYTFEAGKVYRMGLQYPLGLEILEDPENNAITVDSFTPDTATQGDTGVSVTITGTNFAGTPMVRLAAQSLDDDIIEATTITVDSATQITAVFDIPASVPYTGEEQSTGSGTLTVSWYLQVIQDGGFTPPDEFTINQSVIK
jgi:hypothetical protein